MIVHYLKVGIRNLLANKTQTLISLFGLAVAFACVSLASYWNHYERTYDSFQENVDRIYRIRQTCENPGSYFGSTTPELLHQYLKEKYPEVEAACAIHINLGHKDGFRVLINGIAYPGEVTMYSVTEDALDIFDIEWVEGNKDLMTYKRNQIAISEQLARTMCGNKSPLGLTLEKVHDEKKYKFEYEIVGIYKSRPRHSNLAFDIIEPEETPNNWYIWGAHTYVLLKPGVNHENFIRKMQTDTVNAGQIPTVFGTVTPLQALRYTYPEEGINARLEDVNLFTAAAVLLALCAMLNYLTLFISRLRARGRDLALRAICGSTGWQLSGLLLTEYLMLLLGASLLGMLFIEIAIHPFMELAMIKIAFSSVMVSCGCLMLFSLLLAVLLSAIPILYFKQKTLYVQIEATPVRLGKNYFRSVGVCVQLVIGFLFIFCTTVMMKQMYMLINTDNIVRKQTAWVCTDDSRYSDLIQDVLRQQPYINEIYAVNNPLYPPKNFYGVKLSEWEGKLAHDANIECSGIDINDEVAQFYGLKMKEGPASFELGEKEIFINETLAQAMNMDNPIGKTVYKSLIIKGVIYDFQIQNPRMAPKPMMFTKQKSIPNPSRGQRKAYVAFKYDGDWDTCKKTIVKELRSKDVQGRLQFADGEEYYQQFLKSEYNLLKLLGIVTIVSILIAIFGIYALIMQSCDQHQKEIAVRKVFGAQVVDILLMFFKQYMMQVVVAAVIAFPIGYFLMKNWLQQYARQTEISFWIYLGIFVGISLLVTLSIGWRVWKAANENPATAVKKE